MEPTWIDPAALIETSAELEPPNLLETTISYSRLRTLQVNGALTYKRRYLDGIKDPMTDAQILGIATHKKLLEPDTFEEDFIILPKLDRRKPADKAYYEEKVALAIEQRKMLIQEPAVEQAEAMATSVAAHPLVTPLLEGALKELELKWVKQATYREQTHQFNTLAYIDFLNPTLKAMGDLKVVSGTFDPYRFDSKAKREFYHGQTGLYLDGAASNSIPVESFHFILVSTKEPYDVALCTCGPEFLERGSAAAEIATNALYGRLLNNDWLSYPEAIPLRYAPW
jgi:hypothetical protein